MEAVHLSKTSGTGFFQEKMRLTLVLALVLHGNEGGSFRATLGWRMPSRFERDGVHTLADSLAADSARIFVNETDPWPSKQVSDLAGKISLVNWAPY
jgi:hypothetical protein